MSGTPGDGAFSAAQYDDAYPTGVEQSFWHLARNAIIERTLRGAGMAGLPLLEIGSGRGIVVSHLRAAGIDCIGCDLAMPEIEPRLKDVVLTGTDFHALPAERRERFQGVLLCDVIEHIERPAEFLADVRRTLPNVSHLLFTVPARRELWSRWDEHFGHHRRYTRSTLEAELRVAGLDPRPPTYFFHALYPPMFLSRGGRRSTRVAAPRLKLLHRLLGRAFLFERATMPSWLPGTSLITVATVAP